MKSRREFIQTGLALGATLSLAKLNRLGAAEATAGTPPQPAPAAHPTKGS